MTLRLGLSAVLTAYVFLSTSIAQEAASPSATPQHAVLARSAGIWDAEVRMWTTGPDGKPAKSMGVETTTILPGGLWAVGAFDGEVGGAAFYGRSLLGYDPNRKKYVGAWVDSNDPHLSNMVGDFDAASNTLTMIGKGVEPGTGAPYEMKTTTVFKGEDAKVFSVSLKSENAPGGWFKLMEIAYRRRSK